MFLCKQLVIQVSIQSTKYRNKNIVIQTLVLLLLLGIQKSCKNWVAAYFVAHASIPHIPATEVYVYLSL